MRGLTTAVGVGARAFVRRPTARDVPELLAGVRRSRRLHRPWVAPPADRAGLLAWLRRARRPDYRAFLVCRREDGAIAGVVNVSQIFLGALRSAYLGYYALRPHAGQGFLAEGLELVVCHAFRALGLHRLEANVQPANRSSIRLVRRLGFRREGVSPRYLRVGGRWRDHERWAITVEDLRTARRRGPASPGARAARPRGGR